MACLYPNKPSSPPLFLNTNTNSARPYARVPSSSSSHYTACVKAFAGSGMQAGVSRCRGRAPVGAERASTFFVRVDEFMFLACHQIRITSFTPASCNIRLPSQHTLTHTHQAHRTEEKHEKHVLLGHHDAAAAATRVRSSHTARE